MEPQEINQKLNNLQEEITKIRNYLDNAVLIIDSDPASSVTNVGKAVERILKIVYKFETNKNEENQTIEWYLQKIQKNHPNTIGKEIKADIDYLQRYRNMTAHDNDVPITNDVAQKCINTFFVTIHQNFFKENKKKLLIF